MEVPGNIVCLALIMVGSFGVLFTVGSMDADWKIILSHRQKQAVAALCVVQAADIAWRQKGDFGAVQCLLSVLAGCLLAACVMDLWEQSVYRFVWRVGGGAACALLAVGAAQDWQAQENGFWGCMAGLVLYILLQHGLFGRMYGRADCRAFCVCAIAQTAMGGGFRDYVIHMAAAFLGLMLVQGLRKNISADGNLREPVPFLPYITAAFWLWVDFMAGK